MKLSRKVIFIVILETVIIIVLLLAFFLLPGKQKISKPKNLGISAASVVQNRLVVYQPVPNEVMKDNVLQVSGKMKGFFEGKVSIRIKDIRGNTKMADILSATADNYSYFAPFQQAFSVPSSDKGKHTLEFIDVSAKDGSEKVLLTIPVVFK